MKKNTKQKHPKKAPVEQPEKASRETKAPRDESHAAVETGEDEADLSPSVRRLVALHRLDPGRISGTGPGGRVTKGDVLLFLEAQAAVPEKTPSPLPPAEAPTKTEAAVERKPMSPIRKRIAARLVAAKQNTAMLTTFNEIDMTHVHGHPFRQYKDAFFKKYDTTCLWVSCPFSSRRRWQALKEFPDMNAFIEEEDLVYHHDYHIGIGVAIGAEKGLVVPVIRRCRPARAWRTLESDDRRFCGKKIKSNKPGPFRSGRRVPFRSPMAEYTGLC